MSELPKPSQLIMLCPKCGTHAPNLISKGCPKCGFQPKVMSEDPFKKAIERNVKTTKDFLDYASKLDKELGIRVLKGEDSRGVAKSLKPKWEEQWVPLNLVLAEYDRIRKGFEMLCPVCENGWLMNIGDGTLDCPNPKCEKIFMVIDKEEYDKAQENQKQKLQQAFEELEKVIQSYANLGSSWELHGWRDKWKKDLLKEG